MEPEQVHAVIFYGTLAVTSAITLPYLISSIGNSVKLGIKGKYILNMIAMGDNPRKYRNDIQDIIIDGLAGLIMGGRKALFRAFHQRKQLEQSL